MDSKVRMTLVALLGLAPLYGQHNLWSLPVQDTLFVSDVKTTHLLFGEPIAYVDIGSPYFVVDTLNQVLRLKHTGRELLEVKSTLSNLTVMTKKGRFYSIHLGYDRFVEDINFRVEGMGMIQLPPRNISVDLEGQEEEPDSSYLCETLGRARQNAHIANNWGDDLRVVVVGIYYLEDKIGLRVRLSNESAIDFDIGEILFRTKLDKRFNADYVEQERIVFPMAQCMESHEIKGHGEMEISLLFDKFSINKKERLTLDISESNGGRFATLEIPRRKILQPKTLP